VAFGIGGCHEAHYAPGDEEFRDAHMHGEYKMPGGKLVVVDLEVRDGRLADVQVSGDFFLEPDSALDAINRALDGQPGDADEAALTAALQRALAGDVMMYGLSAQAIAIAVRRAVDEEGTAP